MLIETIEAFENMRQTLANFGQSTECGILCITNNQNLYISIRKHVNGLGMSTEKTLVEYLEKPNLNFNDAKSYINQVNNIILWDSIQQISSLGIEFLIQAYTIHPNAGMIVGGKFPNEETYFDIKDIYSREIIATSTKNSSGRFNNIDTLTKGTLITKKSVFEKFDFDEHSIYEYGIGLRKLGYKNYYDKEVK